MFPFQKKGQSRFCCSPRVREVKAVPVLQTFSTHPAFVPWGDYQLLVCVISLCLPQIKNLLTCTFSLDCHKTSYENREKNQLGPICAMMHTPILTVNAQSIAHIEAICKEKFKLILLHVSDCTLFCLLQNLPKHF